MNTTTLTAAALLTLALGSAAFAGMPDAYRTAAPPQTRPAAVDRPPYALTGTSSHDTDRGGPWTPEVRRFGWRVQQVVFTRDAR